MLQSVDTARQKQVDQGYQVEIASIATAVPEYRITQEEALERACIFLPEYTHLAKVFNMTGIEARYSSVPVEWYREPHGWKESNAVYIEKALDLLEKVASQALSDAGLEGRDIDAIVTVSTTGLAIPTLDALLSNRMKLNQTAERTPIFGLGCAGGVSGFARATRIAQSMPGGNVLLLVVELSGLNVHLSKNNPTLFIASALFGDGAAGVILRNTANTSPGNAGIGRVFATGEHMWRDSAYIMGWSIEDDGLDVVLSTKLPEFTKQNLRPAAETFLSRHGLDLGDIDGFVFHPGGPKVLQVIQETLDLEPTALRHSWDVLKKFGNMSAPTVLFILQQTVRSGARGRHLMVSFGPAFTVTFAILDL